MWLLLKKNSGFTLLEMLIAIAIFAMLGLASNAVLQTVMKNDEATKDFSERLTKLQQGFGIIGRDLSQMVARTPRLTDSERSNVFFMAGPQVLDSESEGISFYRLGWLNPDGILPRGTIQAVAYVQVGDKLERWFFPYPDPEIGSEPIKSPIMNNIESVSYSFFIDDKWETKVNGKVMPKAVAIKIHLKDLGSIQRKFLLPESSDIKADVGDSPSSGNNDVGSPG